MNTRPPDVSHTLAVVVGYLRRGPTTRRRFLALIESAPNYQQLHLQAQGEGLYASPAAAEEAAAAMGLAIEATA
ncbi:MAG: hypothetical protein N3Z28_02775 [Synechococcaceae cyanobacterium MAG-AL2]|uniref:hypothetical protein n=1 Tax=Candidatus Regnicoccus frigidus TaxID=3074015 RepID=UPI002827CE7E|nr:hypothetical protein [Candidatus Regnicoccus frigidus]MCT4366580.1 hypothetical protein [Candidatus Regnicoccus frigidus MAG-AL2]